MLEASHFPSPWVLKKGRGTIASEAAGLVGLALVSRMLIDNCLQNLSNLLSKIPNFQLGEEFFERQSLMTNTLKRCVTRVVCTSGSLCGVGWGDDAHETVAVSISSCQSILRIFN